MSGLILMTQHLIIASREPSRLPPAFFTLNGLVGIGLGLATWLSLGFIYLISLKIFSLTTIFLCNL